MLDLTNLAKKDAPATGAFIRDTYTEAFEKDVLAVSMKTPVIVDFWAPWCGPCKQLMPVLEKLVTEAKGAVHMVKVDIDKSPELAQIFRVQSVPTVYAFWQGQPVEGFMGGKPESELRAFIDKIKKLGGTGLPDGERPVADVTKEMAQAEKFFAEGAYTDAMAAYSIVLDIAPDNMDAMAGIGWCFVAEHSLEGVAELLSQLSPEQKKHPRITGLQFILDMSDSTLDLEDVSSLQAKLDKEPGNLVVRYDIARIKIAQCDLPAAIDTLVELTRRNRDWEEQKGRKLLLQLFDVMGNAHPLTLQGRRKLSTVLFS